MAVPEGAYRVRYNVSTVDDAPWLTWIFESDLPGGAAKQVWMRRCRWRLST